MSQPLNHRIADYAAWKDQVSTQLGLFQRWLKKHRIPAEDTARALGRAQALLASDEISLALVGEFSRGKTELINAILFNEYGQRLLPSQAGRTTMCPTELFHDASQPCCLRLLPIETRRTQTSLAKFKRIPEKWVTVNLDPSDHAAIQDALAKVAETKTVSAEEAEALGFDPGSLDGNGDQVAVPVWRHALLNLEHPLLKRGLRIIDTPGLNALGNEPALTLSTLPRAQAIVFMLNTDTGVTASDFDIWKQHIEALRDNDQLQLMAVLNKVDVLWDDLQPAATVDKMIAKIQRQTAEQLKLPVDQVLALSAKQGLLAKAREDQPLLARSNLPALEQWLAGACDRQQQRVLESNLISDAISMVDNTRASLQHRFDQFKSQLKQIRAGDSQPTAQLKAMRDQLKADHGRYHKQLLALRSSRQLLLRSQQALLAPIAGEVLNRQIDYTRFQLEDSWTSIGLGKAMDRFFADLQSNFDNLEREAGLANKVLKQVFERHGDDHLKRAYKNHKLDLRRYQLTLEQLQRQAKRFRHNLKNLLSAKSTVIDRFFNTLVEEVRHLYQRMSDDLNVWVDNALSPLLQHNLYQKQLLEQQMVQLTELKQKERGNSELLERLQAILPALGEALWELDDILDQLRKPRPPAGDSAKVVPLNPPRTAANP